MAENVLVAESEDRGRESCAVQRTVTPVKAAG